MKSPPKSTGFTLVELLVVITIIVILLAMLAPAMDTAIYQAQLAVCATNLKGIAPGVTAYAMNNQRRYPDRRTVQNNLWVNLIKDNTAATDYRAMVRPYLSVNGNLMCSLVPKKVDIER